MHKDLRRALWALPLVTCVVAGFLLYYSVKAPLPVESGIRELAGLGAEVHVEFDELGIPRISAGNAADAYHALGFVTASDRLFQTDLLRRRTAGRLAEILGAHVLEKDRWNRVMGFSQLAGVIVSRLPEAQRHLLEAYAAGVNQAMAAARMFPIEFTFLGYRPEQWRPEDSILVMLAMHVVLSWSEDQERSATVMRRALPPSVVDFLTPESDCYNEELAPRNPARCAPGALPTADLISVTNTATGADEADHGIISRARHPRGSNAWAIGAAKTRDGPLNVVLADSFGNIAWTYMGKIPRRRGMDGLFSESWADGRIGWDGYIPPEEVPNIVNPPEGYIVSANHRMLGADYSTVIGHDFSGGYRAWQISERLKALNGISERDMLALQLDTSTEFYRYYQQAALRALEGPGSQDQPSTEELHRYLEAWDGQAGMDSLGLPLLVEFRRELMDAVLAPLLARCRKIDPSFSYYWSSADVPVQQIIDSGRVELLPDRRRFQDWNGFLRAVLLRSAQTLMKRQNAKSLAEVRWGDVSRVEMRHPLAAGIPALSSLLNMPRAPLAGCGHCIRFAGGSHGATGRMAVAPGHESEGILHMPGGQSGQPGSQHYSDQQESWVEGLPIRFSGQAAARRLTLKPQP